MPFTDLFTAFDPLTTACLLAVLGVAVVTDLRSQRIPNRLVIAGTVAALLLQLYHHGAADGAWRWMTGFAAGFVPFLLLYFVRAVGAGDVKLMGCIGACAGAESIPEIVVATLLAGGVLALAVMLMRRQSRRTLHAVIGTLLWMPFATQGATHHDAEATPNETTPDAAQARAHAGGRSRIQTITRLPYAVAIATGVMLVMTGVL